MTDRHDDETADEQQIVNKPSQAEGPDSADSDAETGMEQEVMDKPSQAEGPDSGDSD